MAAGAYEKLEGTKARKFIDRLNRAWSGSPFDADRTVVHARDLPFAQGWVLAEAADAVSVPEKRCILLDNGRESVPMQFSSDFVQRFTAGQNIRIDRDNAADYLRFWFEYVRTGADRFTLVESLDDIAWREEPTPQARKTLARSVMPLTLVGAARMGFSFKATVLFRDTLMDVSLDVSEKGEVAITDRAVIAESLTVTDPLTGF